ncbi:hypothetical protein [Hymenobacter arizonensis]|uniref:Uncharacterized protein n=1 Tax=Hymenobacter arizonensis TaxID=1227077 RepID=A0A1I6BNL1_HYMAR|nr:hypothetical protein [Hymenobacter arizonensis]SFQ82511.1 hypothetical protein SAMN04515668_4828 [Hymenobacter arizonensis]
MMISAPDTPHGAAYVHFWQLFAGRPLNLARLREAFASMGELAVQEEPNTPWPTTIIAGNGERIPFTVESLLAYFARDSGSARRSAVSDSTIQELLPRWTNATIKEIAGWQGAGFQLRLAKRIRLASKSTHTQDGSLGVSCTWQLLQEQQLVCSSSDTDLHIAESLPALQGKKLLDSQLSSGGKLSLNLQAGFYLAIQPDNLGLYSDYFLDFGWDDQSPRSYNFFRGAFVASKQDDGEQDTLDNS